MRRLAFIVLFWTTACFAQVVGPGFVNYVTVAPSGSCSQNAQQQDVIGLGTIYTCQNGTWAQASGSGGTGITGTLTSGKIPRATGLHTLADGSFTDDGAGTTANATGTFQVGAGLTFDSEFQPGATDPINFFGAILSGTQQSSLAVLAERPAGPHGEGADIIVNCTGTQTSGNGCVGSETDAYTSLNFTVNTPYLFGNAAFAEHDSPGGTVSIAMGSFMAPTNSRTGTAALNTGFYSQTQAGVSPTVNAQFAGATQGASATAYALYFPGTGTGDKALFGSSVTAASYASSGANGGLDGTEGTGAGLTAATSHDLLWPDSTAHRWKVQNNNGTAAQLVNSGVDINTSDQVTSVAHISSGILAPANGGAAAATVAGTGYFWGCAGENGQAGLTMQNAAGVQGGNIIETCQFVLDHSVTVNKITISVTNAAGTAATCDAGVYNTSGTLLVSSNGGFNGNSATTQTVAATPLATVLTPGVYIYGWACTTATTILNRTFALDATVKAIMNSNSQKIGSCSQSATSGILNASCTVGNTNLPTSIIAALFEP